MANIGNFKKVGDELQGEIVTLQMQAKTRALRALCGRLAGASNREVAIALLGFDAVPSGSTWKSSDARSLILRLADTGVRLSLGGYRSLLGRGSDFGTP